MKVTAGTAVLFVVLFSALMPAEAQTRAIEPTWQAYSFSEASDSVGLTSTFGPNRFALEIRGENMRVGNQDPPILAIGKDRAILETVLIAPAMRRTPLDALKAYRELVVADLKRRGWKMLPDEPTGTSGDEPRIAWNCESDTGSAHLWLHYAATLNGAYIVSLAAFTDDQNERAARVAAVDQAIAGIERRPGTALSPQEVQQLRQQRFAYDYSGTDRMLLNSELATDEDRQGKEGSRPLVLTPPQLMEAAAIALGSEPNGAPLITFVSDGRTQHSFVLLGYDKATQTFEYSDSTGKHSFLESDKNVAGANATRLDNGHFSIAKDEFQNVLYGVMVSSGDMLKISRALALGPLGKFGTTTETAAKTDFFSFFHLMPMSHEAAEMGQHVTVYKPSAPNFAPLVTVRLYTSAEGRLSDADLLLKRRFIEEPQTEPFARDIAKSFLAAAAAGDDDWEHLHRLHDQVAYLSSVQMLVGPREQAKIRVPLFPTVSYLAYSGRRVDATEMLQSSRLKLENVVDAGEPALLISAGTAE